MTSIPCARHGDSGAIVDEQKVGLDRGGERDRRPFAIVVGCECSIGFCRSGHDGQPIGRRGDPRPNGGRRPGISEFVAHDRGDGKAAERLRHQIDPIDENQVLQGRGAGDSPDVLKTEPVQGVAVALEFRQHHALVDAVRLEEAVEFVARAETEQAAQLRPSQLTA